MLLIFYSGIRISNILYSLINYLPQNKLGFVIDTSNVMDLSGTQMNLCLRTLIHSLMRVEYPNTYRVHKFLTKFQYDKTFLQFTDLDLAISIYLNEMVSQGKKNSELINDLRTDFSIDAQILPVCEQTLPITLKIGTRTIPYLDYLKTEITDTKIQEIIINYENKKPTENLKEIANNSEYILIAPNDLVSFNAMFHLPGIRKILEEVPCPIFAICPFTNIKTLSEKQINVYNKIGYTALNALEFSKTVESLVDTIIIDGSQKDFKEQIQNLGFQVSIGNLGIKNKTEAFELASFLFNLFPLKETIQPSKTNVVSRFFSRLVKKKI
ncbi:MAG TPA: 2-phospho-L-lactate transferase CofD family protein [Candidatus Deferrimicrobium sp.]|nr:2-phospho-L-lactate transferase CofD family protein [Candidatus Deferrimicrobium sp.]